MNASAKTTEPDISPGDERVQHEILRTLFGYLLPGVLGSMLASVFLIAWYWTKLPGFFGISWLFAAMLVNLSLLLDWYGWRELDMVRLRARSRLLLIKRAAAGFVWVSGVVIVLSAAPSDAIWMLIAVWAGLTVSSIPAMGSVPAAVYWFLVPPAVAIVFGMLWVGSAGSIVVAFLTAGFSGVVVVITRRHHSVLVRGLSAAVAESVSQQTIARQAEELKRLLDERNTLQHMKDQFVAAASHDLRQPAQAIGLLARNLHDSVGQIELKTKTSALIHASDQINDLLNSLLDTAKLDVLHDQCEPEWVSLQTMFHRIEPALRAKAVSHAVNIEFSTHRYSVFSDPLYLQRILQNLLVNAIEHSGGDRVRVSFDPRHSADGSLHLLIVDNGVGMSPAAVAVVDSRGADQPAPSRQSFSVHGMGLSIATRLARTAGHKLTVASEHELGTEFRVHFQTWREGGAVPVAAPVTNNPAVVQSLAKDAALPTILIIDDNALVRVGLGAIAKNAGFSAVIVECVEDALDAIDINHLRPQIIIADWHLGDGITAADVVPKIQAVLPAPVPVIVLTGELSLRYSQRELSDTFGGVSARLLTKPIGADSLKRTVTELITAGKAAESVS